LSPLSADGREREGNELTYFVQALTSRLREKRDYEVIQAWMSVFLRLHGNDVLVGGDGNEGNGVREALSEWKEVAEMEGRRLGELVGFCNGVVGFLRAPRG